MNENQNSNNNENIIYDDIINERIIPKKRMLKNLNNQDELNTENVHDPFRENIPNDNFSSKFNEYKKNTDVNVENDTNLILNKKNENNNVDVGLNNNNDNIVDLRGNIEEQLMQELKNRNNNNNEINEQISDKMSTIKRFRVHGVLPRQK